jgi:hypothetical protein
MLNGITVVAGSLVVSDFLGNKIYRIPIDGNYVPIELQSGSVDGPNGFVTHNNYAYFVTWTGQIGYVNPGNNFEIVNLYQYDDYDKLDGIAVDKNGYFYVSAWQDGGVGDGVIVRFNPDLMDDGTIIAEGLSGPADMKYDESTHSLIVPEMLTDEITVIELVDEIPMPDLIYPDNGQENLNIETTLSWLNNYQGESSFDVQLSKDMDFTDIVIEELAHPNTTLLVNGLDYDQVYYWRVRVNGDGESSAWTNTWSFRTKANIDPPALISPENGSVNQSINPTFVWDSETDEDADYEIRISDNSDFNIVLYDEILENGFETSKPELEYNKEYYWQVRKIVDGSPSDWSNAWALSTEKEVEESEGLNPVNESTEVDLKPQFRWFVDDLTAVSHFKLVIDTDPSFSTQDLIEVDMISTDSYLLEEELLPETKYYWVVYSISHTGEQVVASAQLSFTTKIAASVIKYQFGLETYPNPVENILNLKSNNKLDVKITDINSNEIENFELLNEVQLEVSNYADGVYFINYYIDGMLINTEKFIKN